MFRVSRALWVVLMSGEAKGISSGMSFVFDNMIFFPFLVHLMTSHVASCDHSQPYTHSRTISTLVLSSLKRILQMLRQDFNQNLLTLPTHSGPFLLQSHSREVNLPSPAFPVEWANEVFLRSPVFWGFHSLETRWWNQSLNQHIYSDQWSWWGTTSYICVIPLLNWDVRKNLDFLEQIMNHELR